MKFKNILGKEERASIESITSDFVSLASHQLRTPLSAIKWNTEILINRRGGRLSPRQLQYLREIYRSNERAISLVNDLLDVSRIQEGQIHLELRSTKVEEVVEEVISEFNPEIKAARISINFEIINGPLPKVETDREKLKRILSNLLSNAVRYTVPQGRVRITLRRDPRFLQIEFVDSGIGIAKIDQPKIFKKFFRSPKALKFSPDGTGLGLFIVKSLTRALGGKIVFRSQEGRGTTFVLTLPFKS